jgi:hypothetical protein
MGQGHMQENVRRGNGKDFNEGSRFSMVLYQNFDGDDPELARSV